ncbi:unnamed protein product [Ceutorhynchus assimilis]|uniref:Myotubularin-related protein 14 n=1 Tax=Ceutorhynchus assimilis TaxID=467358 RepID=A0A9P0DKB8_9CUCU|nr:unnamed protein product [Ceutorhynchus assimilis]
MDETQAPNSSSTEYSEKEICDLLRHFSHNTYSAVSPICEPRQYMNDVIKLLEKDYILAKIDNGNGHLCPQYPSTIPVMESVRSVTTIYENEEEVETATLDIKKVEDLIGAANLGRSRQRFPAPVILFNGKFICRSSTLACAPEICYRSGLINVPGYELLKSVKEFWWPCEGLGPLPEVHEEEPEGPAPYDNDVRTRTICENVRNLDVQLMKIFNVGTVVDIMVEKRKVKHTVYVCTSEKVEPRYSSFKLIGLPYPGCEFFKDYYDAMYNAEGLKFKWDHPANDAPLSVPNDNVTEKFQVAWQKYKEWDLVLLTQNYIKYILRRLQEDNYGILLHCISGWDRTPLFISLLRLSLWADYLIHPSLNEYEILYLTLSYDWYLFGHHLSNRLFKHEEILAFCFDFLRYMVGEEFSAKTTKKKYSDESSSFKTDDSNSPTRSQSSGSSDDNPNKNKKKQHFPDFPLVEVSENSNDSSTTVPMDTVSEDSICVPFEDALDCMDTGDNSSSSKLQSPNQAFRRTSPILVGSRRQRSESSGSSSSNLSSNWQMISESGSVERDHHFKPQRLQRLEKVRSIFNTCYQKTVKNESFGPPKKWMIEEIVGTLSQWLQLLPESERYNVGNNGNIEQPHLVEPNGNGANIGAAQGAKTDGDGKMRDPNADDEVINSESSFIFVEP